jgi:hypothetical protein
MSMQQIIDLSNIYALAFLSTKRLPLPRALWTGKNDVWFARGKGKLDES